MCCSVLQGAAGCCRVLQCDEVCCCVLQCVAVCCTSVEEDEEGRQFSKCNVE